MKTKFTKLAIVMSAVLVLMSAIPVVGMACLFCDDETTTAESDTQVVIEDPIVEPIPNTDAVK